ncbi:MAG: GFA family protein [Pseudomonadota bacterium]
MTGAAGRCLCGAVRFAYDGPPIWVRHCHCESCRRACSAPVVTFVAVADGAWRWTGEAPVAYRSSPEVERTFCGRCGSPMSYRWDGLPEEMHFYAAAHDAPEALTPAGHDFHDERLPWLRLDDDLPKHEGGSS